MEENAKKTRGKKRTKYSCENKRVCACGGANCGPVVEKCESCYANVCVSCFCVSTRECSRCVFMNL